MGKIEGIYRKIIYEMRNLTKGEIIGGSLAIFWFLILPGLVMVNEFQENRQLSCYTEPIAQQVVKGTKIYVPPPEPEIELEPTYQQRYASCPITTCNDGTCSSSTGRGTCSWHGGVAY